MSLNSKTTISDKGINVLSLFDGMACGLLAMKGAGVQVNNYYAYEIDKYAIKTVKHNFPEVQELGDVFNANFKQYEGINYLIGGSPCFTKGHLVLTNKGYKDISEIQIGDMVLTHQNRYMPVARLYKRQAKTIKLKVMGYPEFITTKNHPFYSIVKSKCSEKEYKESCSRRKFSNNPEWVAAENLTKNNFCGQHIYESKNINEYNLNSETCYILGRYVADGHIRKEKRKERNNSYQYQLILSVGKHKLKQFQEKVIDRHYSCYPHSSNVYRCVFSSMELVNFIIDKGFGEGAVNKEIPEFIFDLPKELQIAFLDGYLSGDGSYIQQSDEWSMSTVSSKLAYCLQRLIVSIYHTNASVSILNNDRRHYIGNRLIKSNYPLYVIKFKKEIRKQSVFHIQNNIVWTQVKSINDNIVDTVYNIEVEEDHSYTVNNCIVHNCTYWSIAQSPDKRETTATGMGWELFSQYVRALHEAKPKLFIYENNKSMSKAIYKSISETFGFEPIMINSALVSAQNRQRLYWVGKRNADGTYSKVDVSQPKDRGILLKDVIDGEAIKEKSSCPVNVTPDGKSQTIKAQYSNTDVNNVRVRASSTFGASGVAEPVRCFTLPREDGAQTQSKQYRVYNVDGKSTTLCAEGGGMGAKTGLYAVPVVKELTDNEVDYMFRKEDRCDYGYVQKMDESHTKAKCITANISKGVPYNCLFQKLARPIEFDGDVPIKAISCSNGKTYKVYEVKNGLIAVKNKQYPIKLRDGYYIIRKLTVSECKRLQTVPDWYEFPVSDTQAYKMLGNGWTVDVIAHLINSIINEGRVEIRNENTIKN